LQQGTAAPLPKQTGALFWGTIKSVNDTDIVLALRNGELLEVDLSEAYENGKSVVPYLGENVAVSGKLAGDGVMQARIMWRVKGRQSWGTDNPN
jgi:hypothetical protein